MTDVLVNGPDEVWVDRGEGLERTAVRFADDAAVRRLAQRLAAPTGRRLDDAQPWVDARLDGGLRLHAVLAAGRAGRHLPVAARPATPGVHPRRARGRRAASAGRGRGCSTAWSRSRTAFLVTGGTGTGKTTLLAALLSRVDPADRVLLVEDAGELAPDHPHVVRLEARPANLEGAGAVTLRDLVRQALRMRPDRLVVGEVRGAEVVDLLAALNTGHEGGCGHRCTPTPRPTSRPASRRSRRSPGSAREALHSQLASGLRRGRAPRPGAGRGAAPRGRGQRPAARGRRARRGRARLDWDGTAADGAPGPAAAELERLLA